MKLTKVSFEKLAVPLAGQVFYRDDALKGFGVRVTHQGAKSFIVEKRIAGKVKRITIGRYPELTVEQARKQAQKLLAKIAIGIDPIAEQKADRQKGLTLKEVFNDYVETRQVLKPSTVIDYQRALNQVVPDWLDKPILSITKDMIVERHRKHGQERSKARANLAMRILRAIFNFAAIHYENEQGQALVVENPIKKLSHARAWHRVGRRQSVIQRNELAAWYQAVQQIPHRYSADQADMLKDYFLLVLFTGLRRQEAAQLRWEYINLNAKTMTIPDTKNNEPHTMPLSDFLVELFKRRKANQINDYVFPSDKGAGHLVDPHKALVKIRELSGVQFNIHDLRRTFITLAESLDIPVYALKKLLNHKTTADVTAGYIIMDVERLRKPMQMITDKLVELMHLEFNTD